MILAIVSMLSAIALLTGATLAWFTISTNPEVSGITVSFSATQYLLLSDAEDGEYTRFLDISEAFENFVPLHPVSTVDGKNWFIATYDDESGELNPLEDFILDTQLKYANVLGVKIGENDETETMTEDELFLARNKGYYVYTDVWMKTEDEDDLNVRLSVPHMGSDGVLGIEEWEKEVGAYGTYALAKVTTGEENQFVDRGFNAETALRVGFMVYGNTSKPNESTDFIIFEPNCDSRGRDDTSEGAPSNAGKPTGADSYVIGYTHNSAKYLNNTYFRTKPIGFETYKAMEPDPNDPNRMIEVTKTRRACVNIDPKKLIVQHPCGWDEAASAAAIAAGNELNSNNVEFFGQFMNTTKLYEALTDKDTTPATELEYTSTAMVENDIAGNTIIVKLTKDTPIRVRIFIWIEGQDVDCWNDIASGKFYINLELAGETIN